ncbi:hypothetical protein [Halosegnis longus]|uniref:hypothetical protein n=1 Tax=Halosegnis longus TaxID=2216012 RepID=UPI00129EDF84|nr:hypothetical protein [Halosegnis longus]
MAVNKLIPYWITVREVEEPQTEWGLTEIHEEEPEFPNDNLADYFESFCRDYIGDVYVDEEEYKTFSIEQGSFRREGNTIEGVIKSGEWGRNADFWDVDEHERIEDAREENHAEETPYYFLFHIPDEDSHQALLILRKYKRKGIKTLFSSLFHPRHHDVDIGKAYMNIEPHYSSEVAEKLDEADGIASVKFRGRETVPAREQYADRNDIQRVENDISGQLDVGTELKLTPKDNEGKFRTFAKGLIPGNDHSEDFDYGRVEDQNFKNANVTVVEGESRLTFSLWKEQIQMRMDVDPDEYDLDVYGGHPTPHTLGGVARQLANDLMRDINTNLSTTSLIPRDIGVPEEALDDEQGGPPEPEI